MLQGGDLGADYKPAQLHFHWGTTHDRGSEHTVNLKAYAAEVRATFSEMFLKNSLWLSKYVVPLHTLKVITSRIFLPGDVSNFCLGRESEVITHSLRRQ